jgi:adenylosuccinate lyase
MIPRYSRPEMQAIWTEENRLRIMLRVEVLACEAMAARGEIPADDLAQIQQKADFDVAKVAEYEETTRHDVIAFLTSVADHVGPASRHIHKGLTSSDVLDTASGVQLKQAGELILEGVERVMAAVRSRAEEHPDTMMIGRTHGIHAEPITVGLKLASWYAELDRARTRIERAVEEVAVGKISGAVGTYAFVHPDVEAYVCEQLGLGVDPVSTQVVARDRHAAFFDALGLLASSIERFSVEVRHLQRTEVGEAGEAFGKGQKGSSAMPHKRNPILSENLTGLARLVRGYGRTAQENVALWHERDISHSSVERVIAPDATIATDFMLHRFAGLVQGLVINAARMTENLERTGGIYGSQRVLLALVERGTSREEAYRLVQRAAARVWDEGVPLRQAVEEDGELAGLLGELDLGDLLDPASFVRERERVYRRVFDR